MAGMSNGLEAGLLSLVFQAVALANYADNAGSSPETNIATSLHTGDLTATSAQNVNETGYSGYVRKNVARSAGGFSVSGGVMTPIADIVFDTCTSGSGSLTHMAYGKASGGSTALVLVSGVVTPNIVLGTNVQPKLTAATTTLSLNG